MTGEERDEFQAAKSVAWGWIMKPPKPENTVWVYRVVDQYGNVVDNRASRGSSAGPRPFTSLSQAKACRTRKNNQDGPYGHHYRVQCGLVRFTDLDG